MIKCHRCSRPAAPLTNGQIGKSCMVCRERRRSQCLEYKRSRRKLFTGTGVCPNCGNPVSDSVYCKDCSSRATKSILSRYAARKLAHQCVTCGNDLKSGEKFRCRECNNIHITRTRAQSLRNRQLVITHYGGKCDCCGETIYEFLEIDHINGDGKAHRKITGRHVENWIIRNNYPNNLRLLCANCNRGIAKYGICPHKQKPIEPKSRQGKLDRDRRLQAIMHYGCKCIYCGESNWAFLEFDHINNDGNEHRKIAKINAKWIIQNNYPNYLQLLCSNCNKAKKLAK